MLRILSRLVSLLLVSSVLQSYLSLCSPHDVVGAARHGCNSCCCWPTSFLQICLQNDRYFVQSATERESGRARVVAWCVSVNDDVVARIRMVISGRSTGANRAPHIILAPAHAYSKPADAAADAAWWLMSSVVAR